MTSSDALAGKYRLLRPLGKGSMGEVWAALHLDLGREVALKLIYEGSPELATRLKREAQACGRLEHPNIVRIYDIGETDAGDPFLVMELLSGETLAERLERRPRLPPAQALHIALEVARALSAAHQAGIVHRDLKPANVFLTASAQPAGEGIKVLDFGVSKILADKELNVTSTGALVGSPAYMSPEQARSLREIDPRADLWSLGVLLFEMLTGKRPFPSPTVVGVVADILAGPIPTVASMMPGVDPRIDAAVRRCLTRDLDQRMPSAQALIDALSPVLSSFSAPARASLVEVDVEPDLEDLTTQRHAEVDPDDYEATVARPALGLHLATLSSRGGAHSGARLTLGSRGDDEKNTAVLQGAHLLPPPRPLDPAVSSTTQPIGARHPRDLPVSEDMPTAVHVPIPAGSHPGQMGSPSRASGSLRQSTVLMSEGATRPDMPRALAGGLPPGRSIPTPSPSQPSASPPRVISFGAPPPGAPPPGPAPAAWPQPPARTVTLPQGDEADPTRMTLPPGWSGRRDAARILWMTAIAGLVVGLVVFAGLSLLR